MIITEVLTPSGLFVSWAMLTALEPKTSLQAQVSFSMQVERIEKRCLELFGRDYCFSVIPNVNGDICGHYPRHIVFLEYESSEKEKDT